MADFFEFEINIDAKKFREDIENYIDQYMLGVTNYVADEMTKLANKEMQLFYENYEPHSYVRTENLKGHSITRIADHVGDTYRGGVKVSGDDMHLYYRNSHDKNGFLRPFNKDRRPYVIQSFLGGYHGYPDQIPDHVLRPTPEDVLKEKINDKNFNDNALKMGSFNARYGRIHYNYRYNYGDDLSDYFI